MENHSKILHKSTIGRMTHGPMVIQVTHTHIFEISMENYRKILNELSIENHRKILYELTIEKHRKILYELITEKHRKILHTLTIGRS